MGRTTAHGARRGGILVALGLALAIGACRNPRRAEPGPPEATSSRVDVFVRCTSRAARPVRFRLAAAELRDEDGAPRALDLARTDVRSDELASRTALAGGSVPAARYVTLRLEVESAWLADPQGEVPLRLGADAEPDGEPTATPDLGGTWFDVALDLRLGRRDAASIFLDWDAGASLEGGLAFRPRFVPSLEKPWTSLGQVYVCDAARGSVLSIDRATHEIVGTIKAGAGPCAMALLRDRRRMFVANADDGSLSVLDVRTGLVESTLPIAFGARTSDVIVADPARWVAAANPGIDSVTFASIGLDGRTLDVPVGRRPTRLAAAPSLRRVYVLEQGADSVSVIDTNSLAVVTGVSVKSHPSDLEVDREERELYVGHETSPDLLVLDARTLAPLDSIFVGGAVTDLLADPRRSRIYVARSHPPEIVVVERRVRSVVLRMPVPGPVASMVLSRDGATLYAALPEEGTVLALDALTGTAEPAIRCGTRPTDVVIAE